MASRTSAKPDCRQSSSFHDTLRITYRRDSNLILFAGNKRRPFECHPCMHTGGAETRPCSPALFACSDNVRNFIPVALHFADRRATPENRPCRAGEHAFAARRATARLAPWLAHIGNHPRIGAASRHIPGMHSFDFVAHPHAASAEHAAVVVDPEERVRNINVAARKGIIEAHVIHADGNRQVLQFAMTIGDAHRTHVIALGKEEFDDHAAILAQTFRIGAHHHLFDHRRHACRAQRATALDLDQAEPAGADVAHAIEVTERWDRDAVLTRCLEDRLALPRTDQLIVDCKRSRSHRCSLPNDP